MSENWEIYQCSYSMNGSGWGVQIMAKSFEDAQSRLRAIGTTGQVGGPIALQVNIADAVRYAGKPMWLLMGALGGSLVGLALHLLH